MKFRALLLAFVLALCGAFVCSAQDANMGTWKLNEARSHMPAGMGHVNTSTYEAQGDQIKVVSEGVDANGQPTHAEWVGKFDGKDYPVTGTSGVDMRSYRQVNPRTLLLTNKKDGKAVTRARLVTAADGKTRTVTITNLQRGKTATATAVYEKQ